MALEMLRAALAEKKADTLAGNRTGMASGLERRHARQIPGPGRRGKEDRGTRPATRRVSTPSICPALEHFSPSAAPNPQQVPPAYRAAWGAHADRWVVLVEATEAPAAEAVRDDPAVLGYCGA